MLACIHEHTLTPTLTLKTISSLETLLTLTTWKLLLFHQQDEQDERQRE